MAEDTRQPDSTEPGDGVASEAAETPKRQAAAQASIPSQADADKNAKIEEAKARVTAAKDAIAERAAAAPPAAGAARPPTKKKEEGPKPSDASGHPLVKKLKSKLHGAVLGAVEFLGQLSIGIQRSGIVEACDLLRRDPDSPFNYLSDLTCVHFPDRSDAPFEIVYNLYSISANERVRLKVETTAEAGVESVTGVWPAANWMEREVFDLFGVRFANHPDLRRILLPPDWDGHPLRKDYALEFVENRWTEQHLPVMTDVQREQLEQRRAYGLEILSVPEERMMRDIFQGGKEVMPKDK